MMLCIDFDGGKKSAHGILSLWHDNDFNEFCGSRNSNNNYVIDTKLVKLNKLNMK